MTISYYKAQYHSFKEGFSVEKMLELNILKINLIGEKKSSDIYVPSQTFLKISVF